MRLPKDPENWLPIHAELAIAEAWAAFQRYEAKIDFDLPQDQQDDIYRPYQLARERAVNVANMTNWCRAKASSLP